LAKHPVWTIIGPWGAAGAFLLTSFYSVVGGSVFIYSVLSLIGKVIQDNADYAYFFASITEIPFITIIVLVFFVLINLIDCLFFSLFSLFVHSLLKEQ